MALEELDQPGEIDEGAGQPVDLVHDADVDLAGLDVGPQPLELFWSPERVKAALPNFAKQSSLQP